VNVWVNNPLFALRKKSGIPADFFDYEYVIQPSNVKMITGYYLLFLAYKILIVVEK
jgi:hypothetical protein